MWSELFLSPVNVRLSTFRLVICFVSSCRAFGILTRNILRNMEDFGGEYSGNFHWIGRLWWGSQPWRQSQSRAPWDEAHCSKASGLSSSWDPMYHQVYGSKCDRAWRAADHHWSPNIGDRGLLASLSILSCDYPLLHFPPYVPFKCKNALFQAFLICGHKCILLPLAHMIHFSLKARDSLI